MNKTQQGQNFLDMVLQQTGNFEKIIENALFNNSSLSEDLAIGSEINVKSISEESILIFKNKRPATAINNKDMLAQHGGIGYMRVGQQFIVS